MPPFKLIARTVCIAGPLDPAADIEHFDRVAVGCPGHTCGYLEVALQQRRIGQSSEVSLVRWLRESEAPCCGKLGEFVTVIALVLPRLITAGCHSPNDESADQGDDDLFGQPDTERLR